MWNIIISLFYMVLNWITILFDCSNNNEVLVPIISSCDKYTPNTFIPNKECSYGFSGRFCDECGLLFKQPNTKIVGGFEAEENSWPSIIYLELLYRYRNKQNRTQILTTRTACGGSLIDRQTVLTAAHCFGRVPYVDEFENNVDYSLNEFHPSIASMYTVYVGLHDKKKVENSVKADVEDIIIHPFYNLNGSFGDDIAIIKLKKEIKPNCNIQFACLPTPNYEVKEITDAYAAGWGYIDNEYTVPDALYNVKMKIYPNIELYCLSMIPEYPEKQICAGSINKEIDVCNGDSGGPLYILEKVNGQVKYVVVGLVSYGPVPCGIKQPG